MLLAPVVLNHQYTKREVEKVKKILLLLIALSFVLGCGSSRQVSRVGVDTVTDLSGRWNDTDSRLVAEAMVQGCLSRMWIEDFDEEQGRRPVVTVGAVRNLSREHINTDTFTTDIERELINSGEVKFVASRKERRELRDERKEQLEYASDETAKRLAQETGADFLMYGSIKTIVDQIEGRKVIYYQTDLEMVHIESNEKVWIGTKKIKKDISQKGVKW